MSANGPPAEKPAEKLKCLHRNPVTRELAEKSEGRPGGPGSARLCFRA